MTFDISYAVSKVTFMNRTYEIVEKSREEATWGRSWSASFYLDVKTSSFTRQVTRSQGDTKQERCFMLDVRMSSTRMTSGTWPAGWAVSWASSSAGASSASCSWCTACWRTCSCSAVTGSGADHLSIYSSMYLFIYSSIHVSIYNTYWFMYCKLM